MARTRPLRDDVTCDFSDLPETSCAHCRKTPELDNERASQSRYGPSGALESKEHRGRQPFKAQHEGMCDSCGFPIEVGDEIVALNEAYIHWGCR